MTEIVKYQPQTALTEQMDYAKAVANGSLLPREYQGNPANVLIAVGLGQSMGLSPAESLYRITVIQGKPTASAELIAANVRKAGHKLRVRGDDTSCTATIVRADDPDYEFTVTRDLEWAKDMGLVGKDNYKKQPGTMLQWRAITAVARLACPEALYGVAYSSDEMYDDQPQRPAASTPSGGLGAALAAQQPQPDPEPAEDIHDAEVVPDADSGEAMTDATRRHMFALFSERGIENADQQRAGIAAVIGREIESRGELTEAEARQVIASLRGAA